MKRKRHALLITVGAIGLLMISAGVTVATDHLPEDQDIDFDPPKEPDDTSLYGSDAGADPLSDNRNVTAVIEASEVTQDRLKELEGLGASIQSQYENHLQVTIEARTSRTYNNLSWVEDIRRPYRGSSDVVSEGVGVINADDLHANGTTGQNVRVGVIDGAGFDLSSSEISSNIAGHKSFKSSGNIGDGSEHGTATAEVVVDVAPDSDLYVANFNTGTEYANAVGWMRSQNVDVVVMSASFFEQPYDGDGFVSDVADDAVQQDGIVWANSAGNYAQAHWQGSFSNPDNDQWLNFAGGDDEANYLNGGDPLNAGDPVWITLNWDDWDQSDQDYDLHLIKASDDSTVASSNNAQTGSQRPTESIRTTVPEDGKYYAAIEVDGATAPQELEMFFIREGETPEHNVAEGSVTAPAVGDSVTSVGAFFYQDGSLEDFSSHGPTNDGRTGIDVVAPDGVSNDAFGSYFGTSAAAPHVGGAAVLMLADETSLSPQDVEQRLESTATDIRDPGEDIESGHGKVDVLAAVQQNQGPSASFTLSPSNPDTSDTVTFDASGSSDPDGSIQAYEWDFNGDGTTDATGQTASHSYSNSGSYTVELTVTDDDGATDTTTQTISISDDNSPPTASFSFSPNNPDTSDTVTFDASGSSDSDGGIQSYSWNFGDGTTATGETATHSYSNSGTYTVELTVTDDNGATDTSTTTVTVQEPANFAVSITGTNSPVVEGDRLSVDAQIQNTGAASETQTVSLSISGLGSNSSSVSLDGGDSTTETFSVGIGNGDAGDYTAEVSSDDDSDSASVTVQGPAEYAVTIDSTNSPVTEGNALSVTATIENLGTQDGGTQTVALELNSGVGQVDSTDAQLDGEQSSQVTLQWATSSGDADSYTSTVSSDDDSDTTTVTVEEDNEDPTVSLSDTSVQEGGSTTLNANANDPDGDSLSYSWTKTSGPGTLSPNGDTATYDAPIDISSDTSATVEVEVTDGNGGSANDTATITISNNPQPPTAEAGGPYNVDEGGIKNLDSSGSTDPDGSIQSTSWQVTSGPGSVSGGTYNAPNDINSDTIATVELTVTDDDGLTDTDTATVTVNDVNEDPTVSLSDTSVQEGGSTTLNANANDPDGDSLSYQWSATEGSISGGGSSVTYNAPNDASVGPDTVTVGVTDGNGGSDSDTATIAITENTQPPTADAGGPYSVDEGDSVNLDSSGSGDPDGTIQSTSWQVTSGPGSMSGNSYNAPGDVSGDTDVTVELTVEDDDGLTDTDTATVTVRNDISTPTASFTFSPSEPEVDETVNFDASGSVDPDGTIQTYEWDFGDGTTATGETASHSYSSTGTFTIELTVTDDDGATNTTTETVNVQSEDLFTDPLPGFNNPPTNTEELDPDLYEDVSGDGDGTDPSEAVLLWSQLVQSPDQFNSLTQEQVDALDWSGDGDLSPADAVMLWSEQVQN